MGEVLQLRPSGMFRGALFSPDRVYRYTLTRVWDAEKARVCFILLNPSTANEKQDDPTIRHCIAFAKSWGNGGIEIVNLFAYRSTNPNVLRSVPDPFGPLNLEHILAVTAATPLIICGWGRKPPFEHDKHVLGLLRARKRPVYALKVNLSDGSPSHPLYLRGNLTPQPYGGGR